MACYYDDAEPMNNANNRNYISDTKLAAAGDDADFNKKVERVFALVGRPSPGRGKACARDARVPRLSTIEKIGLVAVTHRTGKHASSPSH